MELLILIAGLGFLFVYVAYKESLNIAYRRWQAELHLFERRLGAYQQLKNAVAPVRASGAVSNVDADRFAQAMLDMRFLFNEDLEQFVDDIYGAMLKKHALDALLEKVGDKEKSSHDQALTERALRKSEELFGQITDGVYRHVPERMEKFMRIPAALQLPAKSSPGAASAQFDRVPASHSNGSWTSQGKAYRGLPATQSTGTSMTLMVPETQGSSLASTAVAVRSSSKAFTTRQALPNSSAHRLRRACPTPTLRVENHVPASQRNS
jgi:hypothetical protein